MTEQDWIIRVEKKLTSIKKDIEYIKELMPVCEKKKYQGMIKTNRWLIALLFTGVITILAGVITKL